MAHKEILFNGYRTKTINIRTEEGQRKVFLQQNNELALPKCSMIVGILTREHDENTISYNNKNLVSFDIYDNAYLTLKDVKNTDGPINLLADKVHLQDTLETALMFKPTLSRNIDWNESFIQIAPRAVPELVTGQVIEMVILYLEGNEDNICTINPATKFRTDISRLPIRRKRYELKLNTEQEIYPLSNSVNVGLPRDTAYVVGFSTEATSNPLTGERQPGDSRESTYLTLKRGTDEFVQYFPCVLEKFNQSLDSNINYFPIPPIQVLDMDWEASNFLIRNTTDIENNQVFQIELYWVDIGDYEGLEILK